jgi:hypothetical protein
MSQFGGKDSKRHFTVVMGGKEHGLYVSSTPSSAARKAVTKLCASNKSKKVEFHIREITQGSKKKTYGPYEGHIEKLKEPIELKGRVIKYKPVAKLSGKSGVMKGGLFDLTPMDFTVDFSKKGNNGGDPTYKYDSSFVRKDKLFFGPTFKKTKENGKTWETREYFPIVLFSNGSSSLLFNEDFKIYPYENLDTMSEMINLSKKTFTIPNRNKNFSEKINNLLDLLHLSKFLYSNDSRLSIQSFLQNDLTLEDFKMIHNKIRNDNEHYKYIKNILNRNILFFGVQKKLFINNNDYYPFVLLCGRSGYTILVFEEIEKNDNGNVKKYYTLSSYNHTIDNKILKIKGFFYSLNELEYWKKNNDTSLWGKDFHNCIKSILFVENN